MRGWSYTVRLGLATRLLALLCLAQTVGAIEAPDGGSLLQIGQRVRVDYDTTVTRHILLFIPYSEKKKISIFGELRSWDLDSLRVVSGSVTVRPHSVPITRVENVYVPDGQRRELLKGVYGGASVGLLIGFLVVSGHGTATDFDESSQDNSLAGLIVFGGSIVAGGIIGWFTKVDRWKRVEKHNWPLRLELSNQGGDFEIGLIYSF